MIGLGIDEDIREWWCSANLPDDDPAVFGESDASAKWHDNNDNNDEQDEPDNNHDNNDNNDDDVDTHLGVPSDRDDLDRDNRRYGDNDYNTSDSNSTEVLEPMHCCLCNVDFDGAVHNAQPLAEGF